MNAMKKKLFLLHENCAVVKTNIEGTTFAVIRINIGG